MKRGFMQYVLLLLGITLASFLLACVEKAGPALYPAPALQWYKTFGGKGDYRGHSVHQTRDGGYIMCGNALLYGADNTDAWLIKTDADGNKLWDKTFGGKEYDDCKAVQQTTDGGYIICGTLNLIESASMWLIKTDANGNTLWDKTFKIGKLSVSGYSVQETGGGGYILCGEMSANYIWLIKTDAEGNMIWDKTFENGEKPLVQQTKDGGYIICSRAESYRTNGVATWLIKTDREGNKLWDKTFTSGHREETATDDGDSVTQTLDSGYIICGQRFRPTNIFTPSCVFGMSPYTYIWLIKTDADGNKLWDETFPDKGSACGNSVQQTKDGGYIVCGSSGSYVIEGSDILLLKIAPEQ